jgi:rod shape-determining protein MreC
MPVSKSFTVLGGAIACSLSLMGLPQPQKNYIAEKSRAGIISSTQWLFSQVTSYARNEEKSRVLSTQNVQLALDNMRLREAAWENLRLRKALSFVRQEDVLQIIPAEVIGRDPDQIYDTIVINAGRNKGIEIDWPVVTAGGLVGHIAQVGSQSSVVQLLMRSRVSALVQETRAQGIVSWIQGRKFRLRFVDASSVVEQSYHIVSSGLGGRYPKGIPIGRVTEVVQEKRDPVFQNVYLEAGVDFLDLEEVFVMRQDREQK